MFNLKLTLVLILSGLLIACSAKQSPDSIAHNIEHEIDRLFSEYDHLNTPGYAIGISVNDKTLYKNGYGAANLDYKIPINSESVFSIASVSKQFTSACIALLILENKLSLETPASIFLPKLNKYSDTIRIKHLVYNTSGLHEYYRLPRTDDRSWITFNYFDIDECIGVALDQNELLFKPGTKWDYNNVNFMLLAKIVEKISGLPFSEFAEQYIFKPLGMHNTFIHDDITKIVSNRVTPYILRTQENIEYYGENGVRISDQGDFIQHHRNAPHYGGSGVMSTIDDILKWTKNMVSKSFGGEDFYNLLHLQMNFDHDRDNQAFGLYFGKYQDRKTIAWDGGDWGISAQILRFPEHGVGIIVLSNLGSGESFRKANKIADVLIDNGIM